MLFINGGNPICRPNSSRIRSTLIVASVSANAYKTSMITVICSQVIYIRTYVYVRVYKFIVVRWKSATLMFVSGQEMRRKDV